MCGIAGVFAYREYAPPVDEAELLCIREHMLKRGPDGAGLWVSEDRRVGLAHRRLAIIDLSQSAAQPMATADGRLHVTFNGEIYNFGELRRELEGKGHAFRTQSDTEVLLHLYADRGADMVHALRGMYAFAIWDESRRELFLARDPFGIKPLYYADDGSSIRFASQVKALLKSSRVDTAPEPAGAVGFLIWGAVPEPYTLYRGVRALPAGSRALVSRSGIRIERYFSVGAEFVRAQESTESPRNRRDALAEALLDSVRHHLVADVPVGMFLSAGLDSALVTGWAQHVGAAPLKAITLGFHEYRNGGNDEVPLASKVASHLGAVHQVEFVSRDDFEAERDAILEAMDQPSTDGINTYFVSRAAARAGLKVAMSGLGGDELFGGYSSFRDVPRLASWFRFSRWMPGLGTALRMLVAPLAKTVTSPKFASMLEYGGTYEGAYLLRRALFLPWEIRGHLDQAALAGGLEELDVLSRLKASPEGVRRPHAKVAALEMDWYMKNQLLRDADWAGMAHSLEIRVPLVDVKLLRAIAPLMVREQMVTKAEAVATLPMPLPDELLRRRKTGFSTPVRDWIANTNPSAKVMRGLRGWAITVLPPQPRMFRALVLVSDAFGGKGGIAKFNQGLLTAISRMPNCGQVVAVPRIIQSDIGAIPPRVQFVTAAADGKVAFILQSILQVLLGRFDVVISGHINIAPLASFLARLGASKSMLIIHGIDAWTRHASAIVRASLGSFHRVVGVSRFTLDRYCSWARPDRSRLVLLPNAIDLREFSSGPKSAALARKLGVEGRTVLMTVGRLAAQERFKGFDEVIHALPELLKLVPDVAYVICGEGSDRERLENVVNGLGLRDVVVFAGFIPEGEKPDYYRLADAYVMPSSGEGFGIVFLEAMACGIPAMGSMLDGGREALLDGEIGVLVNPRHASDVVNGIRRTLGRPRGVPEKLSTFSTERYQERVAAVVSELLGDSAPVKSNRAGSPLTDK